MAEFVICPFAQEHLDAVEELEQLCFSQPWSRAQLQATLQERNTELFVALCDGTVAGYAGFSFVLDEGSVTDVAVFPQYRGMGCGRLLVQQLKQRTQELALAFLTLEVRASNQAARQLYEQEGFCVVGRRRGFYQKPTEDAVLMTWETKEQ